ncbi:MAG: hypothetical protein ACT4OG_06580 [Alphaproteobacteria bacterium]
MRRLISVLVFTAALSACDQGSAPASSRGDGTKPVYTVDAVVLERPDNSGAVAIKASGTVRSSGWSDAKLESDPGVHTADTLTYRFVATPPPKDMNVAQAIRPVEASLRVASISPEVKTIRVVAETNRTEVTLPVEEAGAPGPGKADGLPDGIILPDDRTAPLKPPQR